jgi:hypothetical protein
MVEKKLSEKRYARRGLKYSLEERIIPSGEKGQDLKDIINNQLPEELKIDPNYVYIIEQLADKGLITTQDLQETLGLPFETTVKIGQNLKNLGIIKLFYSEAPKPQSWRLDQPGQEHAKFRMMQKERIIQDVYEQEEQNKRLFKWLKTRKGKDWLDLQAGKKGWLDTTEGNSWLFTEDGDFWLKTTEAGDKYREFRNIEEQPKLIKESIWKSLKRTADASPSSSITLRNEEEADKSFKDFSISVRDSSEKRPTTIEQGEPTQAQQIPSNIEDLLEMHREKGRIGNRLLTSLTQEQKETLLKSLEKRDTPHITAEKFSEYKKYLQLRTDENWQESALGDEILEFIKPHLPEDVDTSQINRPMQILINWLDKSGKDKPEGVIIEGAPDQSKWVNPPVSSGESLRLEGSELIHALDFYNLESQKYFRELIEKKIKQHDPSKETKPFWNFLEYNAAKVQALIDLVDNIKAGNDYFEGSIGTTNLEVPPTGARYFASTPIPKRGKYESKESELKVSNSYMKLRELLGNAFEMNQNDLDTQIYDYSKYGGSRVQIEWLRSMGLIEYVNPRWVKELTIDATTRPKDYYLNRWFPAGAGDGQSITLEPNLVIPFGSEIKHTRSNLPNTAVVRYKETTVTRIGEYEGGRAKHSRSTNIYNLQFDKRITPAGKEALERLEKSLFPDFTKPDQVTYARNALSLIGQAHDKTKFTIIESITGINRKTIEEISAREVKPSSMENLEPTRQQLRKDRFSKWEIPNQKTLFRKVFQDYISDEQKIIEKRKEDPKELLTELGKEKLEIRINFETFANRVQDTIPKIRSLIGQSGKKITKDTLDSILPKHIEDYWNSIKVINNETGRINPINIDKLMQPIKIKTISGPGVSVPVLEVKEESGIGLTHAEKLQKIPVKAQIRRAFKKDKSITKKIFQLTDDDWRDIFEYQSEGLNPVQAYQKFAAHKPKAKDRILERLKRAYRNNPEQLERISNLTNTDIKKIIGMGRGGRSDVEAYHAITSAEKDPTKSPELPQRKTISDIRAADVDNTARKRYLQEGLGGDDLEAAVNDHYARIAENYDTVVEMAVTTRQIATSRVPIGRSAQMALPAAREIKKIKDDPLFQKLIAGNKTAQAVVKEAEQSWTSRILSVLEDDDEEEVPIVTKPLDDNNMSQGGFVTL